MSSATSCDWVIVEVAEGILAIGVTPHHHTHPLWQDNTVELLEKGRNYTYDPTTLAQLTIIVIIFGALPSIVICKP